MVRIFTCRAISAIMKRFLYILTSICIVVFSLNEAFAKAKQLDTVAGPMRLTRDSQSQRCLVLLDNKPILSIECEFAYAAEMLAHFHGKFGVYDEVVVLQEMPMGNACNGGPIHLISLRKDGSFQTSGPIEFCGGKTPVLEKAGDVISITFPGGAPNRGAETISTETWLFQDGRLTRTR